MGEEDYTFDLESFLDDHDESYGIYNLRANNICERHLYNNTPPIDYGETDDVH